jgi:hypothetical protein
MKWRGQDVKEYRRQMSQLRKEIPKFTRIKFAINKGVNKYFDLIVREPLKEEEDKGYLLPSLNQEELQIPVAIVSKKYELVQHHEIVTRLETTLRQMDLDPERLDGRLIITEYGERMQASFILPDNYKFDPGEGDDKVILLRVNVINSVDRTTPLAINLTWCGRDRMTGIASRGENLRKKHQSRRPLELISKEFLEEQLSTASSDIAQFQEWRNTLINATDFSFGQIETWLKKVVQEEWTAKDAERIDRIARTGMDENGKDVGSFARVENAYDIFLVLDWVANHQTTIQRQDSMARDLMKLMDALLNTEKSITLTAPD